MKKFMFIVLLISFLFTPFIDGVYMSCSDNDDRHICNMAEDYENSKRDINHNCFGCHHSISFQEQILLIMGEVLTSSNFLPRSEHFSLPKLTSNLLRPPIAENLV